MRVDPVRETIAEIPDFQLRITIWDSRETRLTLRVEKRKLVGMCRGAGWPLPAASGAIRDRSLR